MERAILIVNIGSGEGGSDPREASTFVPARIVSLPEADGERVRRLTTRMRDHDEVAFREFYETYCDRLYRYLIVLTRGNEGLSRDLLQESMTKIMKRMREFDNETHLWNWMAAIARNSFIDWMRQNERAPKIVPLIDAQSDEAATTAAVGSDRDLLDELDRCLLELEPQDRNLIERFYLQEGSYQSLAETDQSTAKAVESKLARIRQKLKAALFRRLRHERD
jgi:RNA polymerase sigma-70 factor, ECF subfamily